MAINNIISSELTRIKQELDNISPSILNPKKPLVYKNLQDLIKFKLNLLQQSVKAKKRYYSLLRKKHFEIEFSNNIEPIIKIQRLLREKIERNNEYKKEMKDNIKELFSDLNPQAIELIAENITKKAMQSRSSQEVCITYNKKQKMQCYIDNHHPDKRDVHFVLSYEATGSYKNIFSSKKCTYYWKNKESQIYLTMIQKIKSYIHLADRKKEVEAAMIHTLLKNRYITESPLVLMNNTKQTIFVQKKYLCDFQDILNKSPNRDPTISAGLCREIINIAEGLKYMHSKGWVHRDIKPTNLFVTPDFHLLIGDLGIITELNKKSPAAGTSYFMPSQHLLSIYPIEQTSNQDFFALSLTLALAVFKDNLSTKFLPNHSDLIPFPDMRKKELVTARKKFSYNTRYNSNGQPIYSSDFSNKMMSIHKATIIQEISKHGFSKTPISDATDSPLKYQLMNIARTNKMIFETQIQQAKNIKDLEWLVTKLQYIPEKLKKEIIFDLRFTKLTFDILTDTINGDFGYFGKQPITVEEIVARLQNLLTSFSS